MDYAQLVDVHGPERAMAMASFRGIDALSSLSEAELMRAVWPCWQALVGALLDAKECPDCVGYGELTDGECPTCGGDGWTYGRRLRPIPHPSANPELAGPRIRSERKRSPHPYDPLEEYAPNGEERFRPPGERSR